MNSCELQAPSRYARWIEADESRDSADCGPALSLTHVISGSKEPTNERMVLKSLSAGEERARCRLLCGRRDGEELDNHVVTSAAISSNGEVYYTVSASKSLD
jgi:hypothetical protein